MVSAPGVLPGGVGRRSRAEGWPACAALPAVACGRPLLRLDGRLGHVRGPLVRRRPCAACGGARPTGACLRRSAGSGPRPGDPAALGRSPVSRGQRRAPLGERNRHVGDRGGDQPGERGAEPRRRPGRGERAAEKGREIPLKPLGHRHLHRLVACRRALDSLPRRDTLSSRGATLHEATTLLSSRATCADRARDDPNAPKPLAFAPPAPANPGTLNPGGCLSARRRPARVPSRARPRPAPTRPLEHGRLEANRHSSEAPSLFAPIRPGKKTAPDVVGIPE